jgi:hypothetical protein
MDPPAGQGENTYEPILSQSLVLGHDDERSVRPTPTDIDEEGSVFEHRLPCYRCWLRNRPCDLDESPLLICETCKRSTSPEPLGPTESMAKGYASEYRLPCAKPSVIGDAITHSFACKSLFHTQSYELTLCADSNKPQNKFITGVGVYFSTIWPF